MKGVKEVYSAMDDDNTVCEALKFYKPDVFANGGDRKLGEVPEYQVCEELGIEMAFSVGGDDKPQSSSWLVDNMKYKKIITCKEFSIDTTIRGSHNEYYNTI